MKLWFKAVRRPVLLDTVVALLLAGLSVYVVWPTVFLTSAKLGKIYGWPPSTTHLHAVGWLAAIGVEVAVLPLRRRLPVLVLAVTLTMAVAHWALLPITISPADVAVAIAVYAVADAMPRRMSAAVVLSGGLIAVGLDTLLASAAGAQEQKLAAAWLVKPGDLIVPALALAAAWIAGDGARTRRAYTAVAERRALDAERDRDQQAGLAAAAERERITRELHDVIAHAISVMVIQAQGAGSALRRRQDGQAGDALDAIVTTGRGALAETRRVLGVVRLGGAEPDLAPQPCLRDLSALAARVRQAGTPVRLHVIGDVRPLPEGIELSAYRIVQEALTNTMKHAGPSATAKVRVRYAADELLLDITDTGHPFPAGENGHGPPGHGLTGMRARIAMLGGDLSAGPALGGGFQVHARLPIPAPVPVT